MTNDDTIGDTFPLASELKLLKWMVGGLYAIIAVLGAPGLWLLLRVAAKVGALG